MSKKYDWFAANLFQPGLSTDDFYNLGLTPDNSEIKAKDAYKSLPDVINKFTNENGEFDNKAFDSFYDTALERYNTYSKSEFNKKIVENYKYDPFDWMTPVGAETKDVSAKFVLNQKNPTKIEYSIEGLGLTSESPFSNREIAQANEVRDENGNKLGYTPNERGGLFKSLSRPTLVLAQYDEDTTEMVDGKQIVHMKGELKLDEHGLPYYEELGNREIYGRDVLHYTDTFTEDGSKWNKYDFFDSDGLDKSIAGTVAKTVFEIAPYFIPYVNVAWGAVNASLEIAQLLPTLGKAINGIISGNNENELGVGLTRWESYLDRFESSVSDYSRDKMVTTENFGNLIADISGQLWQQRVIGSIPKLLEKTGLLTDTSKNIELGRKMALAYMAGTSARESYGAFKEAGATDRVAGIAMIANIVALNKLMQNDYFKNTLFRNSWLDEDNVKRPAWEVAKQVMNDLREANATAGEEANKKLVSRFVDLFTKQLIPGLSKSEFTRASFAEGVEETMEEAVLDLSKAFTEGINALGFNVTTDNENLNFGWSVKDMLSRYAMSFGGGVIGGALFQANNAWETRNIPKSIKNLNESDLSKLTYLIAEGRTAEIKAYYKKLHDKGLLGDPNLSSSKLKTTVNLDGVEEVIAESAEKNQSQNDFVYNALIRHIDYIENLLADEKMKVPTDVHVKMALGQIAPKTGEDKMLRAQVINLALENSGFFNEFNRLANQIVKTRAALEEIYANNPSGDSEAEKKDNTEKLKANETVKELTEKLKKLRKRRDDILDGKLNWYFVGQGLFALDEDTNKYFLNVTKDKFSQVMYGRMYNDLTPNQKERFEEDWKDYQNTEGKRNMYRAYEIYMKLAEMSAPDLILAAENLSGSKVDTIHSGKTNLDLLIEKNNELAEIQPKIKELEAKEVRTSDEEKTLEELKEKEISLQEEFNYLGINTDSLLRGAVETEPVNFREMYADFGQLQMASHYIKKLYSDFITNNMVMRSEDELDSFYRLVKSNPYNSRTVRSRFNGYMSLWFDNPELFNPDETPAIDLMNNDLDNMLLTEGEDTSNSLQDKLVSILQELEDAIGQDYDTVQEKVKEAIEFMMQHTKFNENQALTFIKAVLPHVGSESILDTLSEIETLRKGVKFSPIYDILRKFKASFSDGTLDVVSMINSEIKKLAESKSFKEYVIGSKQVKEELKEIIRFLDALKALVNGSYSGINRTVNKLKEGIESAIALLPEIEEDTIKLLFNDIEFIQSRIAGLLTIAENNGRKKLKIHKETEIKMKPLMLKYYMEDHFINEVKTKLNGVDIEAIWRKVNKYNLNLDYVGETDWVNFEETRLEFESELRQEILEKNKGDFSKALVECFGKDLYKQVSTKIDPDTKVMTAYDMLFYTLDIIAMDSKVFTARYKDILTKTPDLSPVFGQELAIRKFITGSLDPSLYNKVLDHISKLNPSSHKKPPLYNIINVFGGAGTGKTVGISAIAAQILSFDKDIEFVYLAPKQEQVENLAKNVGITGTNYTAEDFEKEFFTFKPKYKFKEITSEKKKVVTWSYSLDNSKKLWKSDKKRKVLIMDESSLFDSGLFSALSDIATKESGIVWTLGDIKQNAKVVDVEGVEMHSGLEDFTIVKSPELTTALRPNYLGKFENGNIFDKTLSSINQEAAINGYNNLSEYDKLANTQLASVEMTMKYHEDEQGNLYGEKFISKDQLTFYINRLKGLVKDPKKIAFITSDDVTIDGVTVIKPENAQGGEWEYVIIDKKWSSSRYDKLRDLYTLTQRSTKGTVIVDNGISNDLNIKKVSTSTAAERMELNKDDKKEFMGWKINSIPTSVITTEFIKAFDKETIGIPPSPSTPSPASVTPPVTPSNSTSSSVTPPVTAVSNPTVPTTPTVPSVAPPATPAVVNPKAGIEKKEMEPLNIPLDSAATDELAFFDILYNANVWKSRKAKKTGLFGITDNLTVDTAVEIAAIVSSAIKENDVASINYLLEIIRASGSIDSNDYDKLKTFFGKAVMELHIVPNDDRSLMIAKFIDVGASGNPTIEIPITVLPEGLVGKYNGEFKRISQPKYKKGEWITLTALQQKYPWLRIFKTWQVLSVDPEQIENSDIFSDATKDYLLGKKDENGVRKGIGNNSGNVFTLVSDSDYLHQRWDSNAVYDLEDDVENPGTYYTYKSYDKLTNIGLNKFVKPGDIVRYSLLLYYKDMKSKGFPINTPSLDIDDFDSWMKEMLGTEALPTSDFYKREYQIISESQCKRLLDVLFRIGGSNSAITKLIQDSLRIALVQEFKPHKGKIYKTGISFQNDSGGYYIEYNFTDNVFDVFDYNNESIGEKIRTIDLKQGTIALTDLTVIFGSVSNVSMINRVFENDVQIKVYKKFVFNQIVDILGAVKDVNIYQILDDTLSTTDEFKYGAFSNVRGAYKTNPMYPNGISRKYIGKADGYATNASTWTPSVFTIDVTKINRGSDENVENDRVTFETQLDELMELVSPIIDITTLLGTIDSKRIQNYEESLNTVISQINNMMLNASSDWNYSEVVKAEDGGFRLEQQSDLNQWLQNKFGITGEINLEHNYLNSFKFGIFSVSLSNNYVIWNDGKQWNVDTLKSHNDLKTVLDVYQSNSMYQTALPDFITYIKSTIDSSINSDSDSIIGLFENPTFEELTESIIDYLDARIKNEEC